MGGGASSSSRANRRNRPKCMRCRCKRSPASQEEERPPSTAIELLGDTKSPHNPGQFQEGQFVNGRNLLLRTYFAKAQGTPRAAILVHHGIRSHALFEVCTKKEFGGPINVFEGSIAEKFTKLGFEVWAYDAESHGLSEGLLGSEPADMYFESIAGFVEDFKQFARLVRSSRNLPIFGYGTSMGGGIVIGAARADPPVMDGMVLVAPMISVEKIKSKPMNKVLLPLAGFASRWLPTVRLADMERNPDDDSRLSFERDPLNESNCKMRVAPSYACVEYCEELQEHLAEVKVPFLTLHSREDTFTDFSSSERLYATASVQDKSFLEAPAGSCHALMVEAVSRDWAHENVVSWLQKHTQ